MTKAAQCCHHSVAVVMDVKGWTFLLQDRTGTETGSEADTDTVASLWTRLLFYQAKQFRLNGILPVLNSLRQSRLLGVSSTVHHQLFLNASHTSLIIHLHFINANKKTNHTSFLYFRESIMKVTMCLLTTRSFTRSS